MKSLNKTGFVFSMAMAIFLFAGIWFLTGKISIQAQSASLIAAQEQELKGAIDKKSQELLDVSNQIKESQKNLEQTQGERKTLQKEVGQLDSSISQVNLGIKQSSIKIEKLNLEMDQLGYSIINTESQIHDKRGAISSILQELQLREGESPLLSLLKNKSLAEGILDAQSLIDLNGSLTSVISDLKQVKTQLADDLRAKTDKKNQSESEKNNLHNKQLILADVKQEKQTLLTQTKNKEQIYQKSLSDLEKRQSDIAAEIEKLDEQLRLKINPSLLPSKGFGVLRAPVIGPITQAYGSTNFARTAYLGKWHNGLDFGAAIGTPVVAAASGRVISVANEDLYCPKGAYGKYVAITHDNNLTTLYAHLSLYVVKEGDIVEAGQVVGYSGKTGYATGPHLHFGVYATQTFKIVASRTCGPKLPVGGDLNPADYLSL